MSDRVHVIAEAGTNHGGELSQARQLVDIAVAAGADSVKFQVIYPEGLYLPRIWDDGKLVENETFHLRAETVLADDDWREIAGYARDRGLPLSASIFDERGLDLIDALDAPYIKLASTDVNHAALIRKAAERGRKVILSTGLSTLPEIETAVKEFHATGNTDLVLLHCVSIYPAPVERANIRFVEVLRNEFGLPVGFSDHTPSSVAAVAAVALGATWFEKHITFDRSAPGFDHSYAAEPPEFAQYVADIRAATDALRVPEAKLSEEERAVARRARRSLYAARSLAAGTVVTEDDVLTVRPPGPADPNDVVRVIGRRLTRDLQEYEAVTLDVVENETSRGPAE